MVNGNENNAAIFWPEYFRCDKEVYDLQSATKIAAYTVLMGAELNPSGVGGLEIWQYDEAWKSVPPEEIESIEAEFQQFQKSIRSAVL